MRTPVMDRVGTARLAAVGAAVLWGTTGTAQALGPAGSTPPAVGALRIAVGAAGLVVLASRTRWGPARAWTAPGARAATLVGMVAVAAYQVCFFAAVARTGVAVGTVVGIGTAPAVTGLLGWLALRERPEGRWWTATALAVAGSVLLLLPAGPAGLDTLGVVLAIGAGSAYAAYALASKVLLEAGRPPVAVMAVLFGGGAVLLLPVLASADLAWVGSLPGATMVVYLGVVTVSLSYVWFVRGLSRLPTATVATLSLAEPLTASILGVAVLGERPGVVATAGALLVLAGLVLLAMPGAWLRGGTVSSEES